MEVYNYDNSRRERLISQIKESEVRANWERRLKIVALVGFVLELGMSLDLMVHANQAVEPMRFLLQFCGVPGMLGIVALIAHSNELTTRSRISHMQDDLDQNNLEDY